MLATDPEEAMGVNDRRQLAAAEAVLRRRLLDALMLTGVTVEDPATTYVDVPVRVGLDTVLRPMTVLRGETVIGRDCEIGPMAQIRDSASVTGSGSARRWSTRPRSQTASRSATSIGCGPAPCWDRGYLWERMPRSRSSRVGAGSRINHFSRALDSDVGSDVNIGAGTVTCNYDGAEKHRTAIGDGAFIGSKNTSSLCSCVGRGAYVAAASAVTKDVPDGALAVGRARQRNIEGWHPRERPEDPRP